MFAIRTTKVYPHMTFVVKSVNIKIIQTYLLCLTLNDISPCLTVSTSSVVTVHLLLGMAVIDPGV